MNILIAFGDLMLSLEAKLRRASAIFSAYTYPYTRTWRSKKPHLIILILSCLAEPTKSPDWAAPNAKSDISRYSRERRLVDKAIRRYSLKQMISANEIGPVR